jgi:ADP-ribose pyrophosphatase YjhB (NUDIX family)
MKFCSECAHPVTVAIPEGDNRPRYVCTQCGTIHYQNPKMVIGSIPVWEQDGELKVLLCKRAIEPRYGYWTLPAGFMENEETTGQAAVRETEEEAGANVELGNLFTLLNVAHVHQVHMFYLARLLDLDFAAGIESLDVQLFAEHEIPGTTWPSRPSAPRWNCSSPTAQACSKGGSYGFHSRDITRPMRAPVEPD